MKKEKKTAKKADPKKILKRVSQSEEKAPIPEPRGRGRPKKELDYKKITTLSQIHCTQEEIASVMEVSVRTLQRNKEFCRIYKKGMEEGKASLRRMQFAKANEGNTTMMIWLGKQLLGQADKVENREVGKREVKVTYVDQKNSNGNASSEDSPPD